MFRASISSWPRAFPKKNSLSILQFHYKIQEIIRENISTLFSIIKEEIMFGFKRKKGQGMTEYIIIVGLIALSAIVIVSLFGQQIKAGFASMTRSISGQASTTKTTAVTQANTEETQRGNLAQYRK